MAKRRKPKSQRPSHKRKKASQSKHVSGADDPRPLHEVVFSRYHLEPGEFMIRCRGYGGGLRLIRLSDWDDWCSMEATWAYAGGLEPWKQNNGPVEVVDHNGIYHKLRAVGNALRPSAVQITIADVLKSWGVHRQWEDVESKLRVDPNSLQSIDVVDPPYKEEFESLWQEWLDKGIADRVETLYHGTVSGNVASILTQGFRLPKRGYQAFGRGIYLGPVCKAENYAYAEDHSWWRRRSRNEGDNPHKLRFLIEADVLVGDHFVPHDVLGSAARREMHNAGCQSVYYGGFTRPEWVVYNPAQVLIRRVIRLD